MHRKNRDAATNKKKPCPIISNFHRLSRKYAKRVKPLESRLISTVTSSNNVSNYSQRLNPKSAEWVYLLSTILKIAFIKSKF